MTEREYQCCMCGNSFRSSSTIEQLRHLHHCPECLVFIKSIEKENGEAQER
jgi:DNA-directed RNA polymerase subunit RPC12/RpoP